MAKSILGACAILLYGSLAMASGIVSREPVQSLDGLTMDQDSVMLQKISEEERERRVQVCERELEYCRDWCTRTKGGRVCYEECSEKLAACMKKIPYAE